MNKLSLSPLSKINKSKYDFKIFFTQKQLDIFLKNILPKFLSSFEDKYKQKWQNTINEILPNTHLNFKSENDFLILHNITKENVVENSIKYVLTDINNEDLLYLTQLFSIYIKNNKIRIIKDINIPIYLAIIEILEYINKIKNTLNTYPKYYGNHLGTKYRSSSYKKLLEAQIKMLKDRLDGRFFNLENDDEIKKTKSHIKFIELSLTEEYKNFPEWLNFANIIIGLNNKILENTKLDIEMLNQLLFFFNGIKTSKEELLKSVTIFLNDKLARKDNNFYKIYADNIMDITRYFFNDDIIEIEKSKNKKTFSYNKNHIEKSYHIKTYLNDTPIYMYSNKTKNDAFNELFNIAIDSMTGLKNIFDIDNSKKEALSEEKQLENFTIIIQDMFNLTNEEIKIFMHLSKIS
jgi:hypothetical protein